MHPDQELIFSSMAHDKFLRLPCEELANMSIKACHQPYYTSKKHHSMVKWAESARAYVLRIVSERPGHQDHDEAENTRLELRGAHSDGRETQASQ